MNARTGAPATAERGATGHAPVAGPLPLYHQIYTVLRERIVDGLYPPQRTIPSEKEFSAEFAVSRVTIRKTFELLEKEGLIARRRGRGTFVSPQVAAHPVETRVRGLVDNLIAMGLKTKVSVLEFGYVAASPAIAEALAIASGATVQRSVRLRSYGGRPFSHTTSFVPEAVGRTYTRKDLAGTFLMTLFERAGIHRSSASQRIGACAAEPRIAEKLGVSVGAPLLTITRVLRNHEGLPVEYSRALYRSDRYEFEASMTWDIDSGAGYWRLGEAGGPPAS